MCARKVVEWIGRTDDSKVPPRVRLRIWEKEHGICHLSGRRILAGEPWELDHVPALINGGQNRESMLFPALKDKHREKTNDDLAEKSKVAAVAKKHVGAERVKATIKSAGFAKSDKSPTIEKRPLAEIGMTEMQRRYGVTR